MQTSTRRRRALSTLLALVLAVESVSAVAAAARVNVAGRSTPDAAATPTAGEVLAGAAPSRSVVGEARSTVGAGLRIARAAAGQPATPEAPIADAAAPAPLPAREAPRQVAKAQRSATAAKAASPAAYRGRNHVWIPALRINRSVHAFPCERSRPPDNYVYRWGCAGKNNVYLMGHAHSVFKPLHDAYVGGRLRKGMRVYYADAKGRVRAYAVRWWRVTAPTTSASWAWASLSRPSMTLQTCVGRNSQYRLMVRLVEVRS